MIDKEILDVACGSKMFYFDKNNESVLFCDIRAEKNAYCTVEPDVICDFTDLPFIDETFSLIVYDPPHAINLSPNSFIRAKYGMLVEGWEHMLKKGFDECWRVLRIGGTLIFKWGDVGACTTKDIIRIFGKKPVFGNRNGYRSKAHWLVYFKAHEEITKDD